MCWYNLTPSLRVIWTSSCANTQWAMVKECWYPWGRHVKVNCTPSQVKAILGSSSDFQSVFLGKNRRPYSKAASSLVSLGGEWHMLLTSSSSLTSSVLHLCRIPWILVSVAQWSSSLKAEYECWNNSTNDLIHLKGLPTQDWLREGFLACLPTCHYLCWKVKDLAGNA